VHATQPVPATPPDTPDLWRKIGRALAESRAAAPKPRVTHDGPCGERRFCPRGCRDDVATLERLQNGHILNRCCVFAVLTPNDYQYAEFAAAFA
jgi:hypothetical protein